MTGWDKLLGNNVIKGTVKEEPYDSDFDPEPPKKKQKLSQQKSKPKGKKKPCKLSKAETEARTEAKPEKKIKHNIVEQNNALKCVGIEYVISKNHSGKRSRRGWLCSTNNWFPS